MSGSGTEPEPAELAAAEPSEAEDTSAAVAEEAVPSVHVFGIRHHGPGSARSLVAALAQLEPDCVLIEGPPEADALVPFVLDPELVPPVALLAYCLDDTALASFFPLAVYSPEWQALCFGAQRGLPVRFIDLPQIHSLALRKAAREAAEAELAALQAEAEAEEAGEAGTAPEDETAPQSGEADPASDDEPTLVEARPSAIDLAQGDQVGSEPSDFKEESGDAGESAEAAEAAANAEAERIVGDPLDWLGRAAGHGDGERWWNQLVEERSDTDPVDLFAAIAEAMGAVRAELSLDRDPDALAREVLREAHMRKCVRQAQKDGFRSIAVVVGAWHVPALTAKVSAKADNDVLRGLPKAKVVATWVPWTEGRLASDSGYAAGVRAPAWYGFLWQQSAQGDARRAVVWLSRVAGLLRAADLDTSSAHVIEAVRLSETLAALRGQAAPGLDEFDEAVRTIMCFGDDAPLKLIRQKLVVGEALGQVPASVPVVPLQQDLNRLQKSLRLKPEASARDLDLDLRKDTDLSRSQLFHRLGLLGVPWAVPLASGVSSKGTFHEHWRLVWAPELALRLVEASRWGATIADAATARAIAAAGEATSLAALSRWVSQVLTADLPQAVEPVVAALERHAARTGDVPELLEALPALAEVMRYGDVRRTDAGRVAQVLDGLVARASIGLGLACLALDDAAAETLRDRVAAAHRALNLVGTPEQRGPWLDALGRLADSTAGGAGAAAGAHGLLCGLAARLRFDAQLDDVQVTGRRMAVALSVGHDPGPAAAWIDGFLQESALVLLHDDGLWRLLDAWVAGLGTEDFIRVLPLVRRALSRYSGPERRQLGERAARDVGPLHLTRVAVTAEPTWDPARAAAAIPTLRVLLGLGAEGASP